MTNFLLLTGLFCEIIGAWLMAHVFLRLDSPFEKVSVLLSALYKGKTATTVADVHTDIFNENKTVTLQGFSFIFVGFVMQFFAVLLSTVAS